MRAIRRFQALASLLVAALVLAACGGAEPAATTDAQRSATEGNEAPATTTTAVHEDEHTETTHGHDEEGEDDHEDGSHVDDADADVVVEVVMDEFAFSPESIEVHAGQTVKFVVHNEGQVEHEFRLSNGHRIEEHIASGHADHEEGSEGGHHGEDADMFVLVDAGATGELVVTFPEDTSIFADIACLLPGHFEAGMVGSIEYSDA